MNYFIDDLTLAAALIVAVLVLRGILRAVFRGVARRAEDRRRERQYMATVVRLAWMLVNERPSKVVYFTKAQVEDTPDAAYLKLELSRLGYALKSAESADPAVHRQMII